VTAREGMTLLEAAQGAGIYIPTICHHEKLEPYGGCRLCIVEVEKRGRTNLVVSCVYPVEGDLVVTTRSEKSIAFAKPFWNCNWPMRRMPLNCRTWPRNTARTKTGLKKRRRFAFTAVSVSGTVPKSNRRTPSVLSTVEPGKRSVSFRKSPPRSAGTARNVFPSAPRKRFRQPLC
jgi:hypothetical protein